MDASTLSSLQRVARDPNASFEQLRKAIPYYPREVLNHPVFPLSIVVNFEEIRSFMNTELQALVRFPEAPEPIVEHAITQAADWPNVAMALLSNPNLTKSQAERVIHAHQQKTANKPLPNQKNHKHFDGDWDQRPPLEILHEAIITNRNFNNDHYETYKGTGLVNHLFTRPLNRLPQEEAWHPVWIAEAPYAPPEKLAELAENPSSLIRSKLASHPRTPPETLAMFYNQPGNTLSAELAIAGNPNTPEHVHKQMIASAHPAVHKTLAENPAITPGVQMQLAEFNDTSISLRLAQNPGLAPIVQDKLVEEADRLVHWTLLENSNSNRVSDRNLAVLQAKGDPTIREVAREYQAPTSTPATREDALTNLVAELIGSSRPIMLELITATCNNTPPMLLTHLAGSFNPLTRLAVAIHPNTPEEVQELLQVDPDLRVSNASLHHTRTLS